MSNYVFRPRDAKAVCQRCASDWNRSKLRKEWTGLLVCPPCYDVRNPADFIRGIPDPQRVPGGASPPAQDVFVNSTDQLASTL